MKKARILLSGKSKLHNYTEAVNESGGIAYTKYLPEIDTDYDGLILCGGGDINPKYYGEDIDGSVKMDDERDRVEFELLKAYVEAGKPVLGICRGFQLINVFFGGSLYQDIKNAKEHSSFSGFDLVHPVSSVKGSIADKLYGDNFVVNSAHHQAVKQLGKGLKVNMMSGVNTVIEGVEHESLPIFAVQWHPERMCFSNRRPDTVDGAVIFEYFLRMCEKQRERF